MVTIDTIHTWQPKNNVVVVKCEWVLSDVYKDVFASLPLMPSLAKNSVQTQP